MCINVAFSKNMDFSNKGQKLAGTGIFVSRAKKIKRGRACYDDPLNLKICRLHFEKRHESGFKEAIPVMFSVATPFKHQERNGDRDVIAFEKAIMESSQIGRGYWRAAHHKSFSLPPFPVHEESVDGQLALEACAKGRWAFVVAEREERDKNFEEKFSTLGGWHKDGNGCHLSYAIPIGAPIEYVGEGFSPGPSGIIYDTGSLRVKIPVGTKWALWIRCSDTGKHSGFTVVRLWWEGKTLSWYPVMVSLFRAPHIFPEEGGRQNSIEPTLKDVLELAEKIASDSTFSK